jgi:hypothetical protein
MWTGAATPRAIRPAHVLVSYLAPDTRTQRLDIARFTTPDSLGRGQHGGAIQAKGVSLDSWCADTQASPCISGQDSFADVHLPGRSQGVIGWSSQGGAWVRYRIPRGLRNVHGFDDVQFRAAVNPGYPANRGIAIQDLTLTLVDGSGHDARVRASRVGNSALAYPLGPGLDHVILSQVRFPLSRFSGVNLHDITSVTLHFNRTRSGVVDVADLSFSRGAL